MTIDELRKVEACERHRLRFIPCPDGREGCAVAHFAPAYALGSAHCCDDCARRVIEAVECAQNLNWTHALHQAMEHLPGGEIYRAAPTAPSIEDCEEMFRQFVKEGGRNSA